MLSTKAYFRLFFVGAVAVLAAGVVSATNVSAEELQVSCSDGNRQMCEKIITQTGEKYKYYI